MKKLNNLASLLRCFYNINCMKLNWQCLLFRSDRCSYLNLMHLSSQEFMLIAVLVLLTFFIEKLGLQHQFIGDTFIDFLTLYLFKINGDVMMRLQFLIVH